jgi:hypothetical protein
MKTMKTILLTVFALCGITLSATAQGFYFDIGIGMGWPETKLNNSEVDLSGTGIQELGIEWGAKAGFGPIAGVPLYLVAAFQQAEHMFEDDVNYIKFDAFLIGGGVIFYPISKLQLAGSVGYSFVRNDSDFLSFYQGKDGIAWDVSAAYDVGLGNSALLIGIRYFSAHNTLEVTKTKEVNSLVSIFIRYAYRHKATKGGN